MIEIYSVLPYDKYGETDFLCAGSHIMIRK